MSSVTEGRYQECSSKEEATVTFKRKKKEESSTAQSNGVFHPNEQALQSEQDCFHFIPRNKT